MKKLPGFKTEEMQSITEKRSEEEACSKNKRIVFAKTNPNLAGLLIISFAVIALAGSCKKDNDENNKTVIPYQQVNLVADTAGFNASITDVNLKNAWGISIGPTGVIWISSNHTGTTVVYDSTGTQHFAPINIPLGNLPNGASPTGVVYNATANFVIPGKGASKFIYSTEDGIISAWNNSTAASTMTVADRSAAGAVYKGIAMADDGGSSFLYVTDFHNAKVDVFDINFALVSNKPFNDPAIPAGFAPFDVQNIGGQLYITYAKQLAPDNHDDQAGPGNGYVDVYTPAGILVKRFASQGTLNSPWGIVSPPTGFGQVANAILIGNFGDGHISVFDMNGGFQGLLMKNNADAISIEGLWAITFDNVAPANPNRLYFTAGPGGESHGLFGYLQKM